MCVCKMNYRLINKLIYIYIFGSQKEMPTPMSTSDLQKREYDKNLIKSGSQTEHLIRQGKIPELLQMNNEPTSSLKHLMHSCFSGSINCIWPPVKPTKISNASDFLVIRFTS